MPTIKQLPVATSVAGTDALPLSQSGFTRSVTVSTLLNGTQPAVALASGMLLGRISAGSGGPEPIGVGTGVALQSIGLVANGEDHLEFAAATGLLAGDEVLINSQASPKRLPATQLRTLFSAGSGVTIDGNGVISASTSAVSLTPASPTHLGAIKAGSGLSIAPDGTLTVSYGNAAGTVAAGNDGRISGAEQTANRGQPSGYAALDGNGKVPITQLPAAVQGALNYQGTWNAGANTPALSSGSGAKGWYYTVSTAGSTALDGISQWNVGDHVAFNGTVWEKIDGAASEVLSVAGRTGAVVLTAADIGGLSAAATASIGTGSGTLAAGNDARIVNALQPSAIPAASGALLGGTGTAGTATTIAIGAGLTISGGTLSLTYSLPTASQVVLGGVKIDGTTITINGSGVISAALPPATASVLGGVKQGAGITIASDGTISSAAGNGSTYTLPPATASVLGGVKQGAGITIASDGTISSAAGGGSAYTLPPATASVLGGVKQGAGITIASDGTLSDIGPTGVAISSGSAYAMQPADRVVDVTVNSTNPLAITLPTAPVLWGQYTIVDGARSAATHNITITAPNSGSINGLPTFVLNENGDAISLVAVNATTWRII